MVKALAAIAARTVAQVMSADLMTLKLNDTLRLAGDTLNLTQVRHFPVLDGDQVAGIVNHDDLLHASMASLVRDRNNSLREALATVKVKDIVEPDPIRISVDKDLHHLTALMHAYHVRRVPIVNGFDTALGVVTLDDLIAQLGDQLADIGKTISEEFPQGNA